MRAPRWTRDPDPWLVTLVTLAVIGSAFTILLAYAEDWDLNTPVLVCAATAITWWGVTLAAISAHRGRNRATRNGRR